MIFTIGHTKSYEKYFKEQGVPKKAIGGSVWRTKKEAQIACPKHYSVYGVDADWKTQTVVNTEGAWHDLSIEAPLVKEV